MIKKNKFSVITVCFNSERTIRDTIESVLKQTYTEYEYLIIDGKSDDTTLSIIKEYETSFEGKMKLISEKDNGIYDAMNKGIQHADGDIIGFINSDDWLEPDALENINNEFILNNCEVVYGLLRFYKHDKYFGMNGNSHYFINDSMIAFPTCFIKKSVYEKYGVYNTKYKSVADYDYIIQIVKYGVEIHFVEKVIANFRIGGMSSSLTAAYETNSIRYKYGFISFKKYLLMILFLKLKNLLNII
ncbi:MAG: glycosyltransferase [Spirochaetae bacterium HGW-Spirochaetae-5]|nr:MAG: glycosyltransferase [Spirochaetae bacterium HGW-Spirochaetae-5]